MGSGSVCTTEIAPGFVLVSVDGQYCMTCGSDKIIKLWNPRGAVLLKSYTGHGYEVLDCKASCDNANMCSGGMDKTVIFWDVASGNVLRKYRGHAGRSFFKKWQKLIQQIFRSIVQHFCSENALTKVLQIRFKMFQAV